MLFASPEFVVFLLAVYALHLLGGVVLAITGGEAVYADMGHFGKTPIRLSWIGVVYPALIASYLGQGAFLLGDGEA